MCGRQRHIDSIRLLTRTIGLTAALVVCGGPRPAGNVSALPQLGLPPLPPPIIQLNPAKFDPLLLSRASLSTGQSPIIATAPPGFLNALAGIIRLTGGTISRQLSIINGIAATVPNSSLRLLSATGFVQHLAYDRMSAGAMERTGPTVGATAVRQELGCDGSNI